MEHHYFAVRLKFISCQPEEINAISEIMSVEIDRIVTGGHFVIEDISYESARCIVEVDLHTGQAGDLEENFARAAHGVDRQTLEGESFG